MTPQALLERLLFDPELRERFAEDPAAVAAEAGLGAREALWFRALDPEGLALDAELRRRYLMSALCRAYPLAAAGVGAFPEGPRRLAAFLASPAVFKPLAERNRAFGEHLQRLLDLGVAVPRPVADLLRPLLALERALVEVAGTLRGAAARDEAPGPPTRPDEALLREGRLVLPEHVVAVGLPQPSEVVAGALGGVGPGDAWTQIAAGTLEPDRLVTVARAEHLPVTVICRGYVRGASDERAGGGGVAPLVDVGFVRAELAGAQGGLLQRFNGQHRIDELPPSQRRLARHLVDAGVVALRADPA